MKFGLLLYTDVEPVDLATVGVISMARRVIPELSYVTLAVDDAPVTLSNGLRVIPDYSVDNAPALDMLIVPGGPGWPQASRDQSILGYLNKVAPQHPVASVCTGAMLLASAGLLSNRCATTKVETRPPEEPPLEVLSNTYPDIDTQHALIVEDGTVVTGGGVSLCIDTMLYLIERHFGESEANEVARIMEYQSARAANQNRLKTVVVDHAA